MPLFKQFLYQNSEITIWKFNESENFDDLVLCENDLIKIKNYHPKKKAEFLMVRRILKEKMPGARIIYNESGAPALENYELNISISHSFPYAALAFSENKIGIDLESFKEKIIRVKNKFITEDEQKFIPQNLQKEYLTVIWSIKESLYKLHHSKYWSLKKHYEVRPFSLEDEEISCRIHNESFSEDFIAKAFFFEGFVLTAVR